LRWIPRWGLDDLEQCVLRVPALQRALVTVHRRAFRHLLTHVGGTRRAAIVGGGLFPRTAVVLRDLLPSAELLVIDADAGHLATARAFLDRRSPGLNAAAIKFEHRRVTVDHFAADVDLVVFPLAFRGDRRRIYERPPARTVLVHDWIWNRRGRSCIVSWLLLKRLNLVTQ
jgi:hypothetical protein